MVGPEDSGELDTIPAPTEPIVYWGVKKAQDCYPSDLL